MFQLFTQLKNTALVRPRVTCQENKKNLWKTKDWEIYRENAIEWCLHRSLSSFGECLFRRQNQYSHTHTHIKEALMLFAYLQNTSNMLSQVMHKTLQRPANLSEILQLNHSTAVFHYWLTHLVHSWRVCLILLLRITVFHKAGKRKSYLNIKEELFSKYYIANI